MNVNDFTTIEKTFSTERRNLHPARTYDLRAAPTLPSKAPTSCNLSAWLTA